CCPVPTSAYFFLFFFHAPAPAAFSTLSLHDALPICVCAAATPVASRPCDSWNRRTASPNSVVQDSPHSPPRQAPSAARRRQRAADRKSHTSELQSRSDLVCRLLLEKKKQQKQRKLTG